MEHPTVASLRLDHPLSVEEVLEKDRLRREPFAMQVTQALKAVSRDAGLVVAVEGSWGCGKTTLLNMVEALLRKDPAELRPVVVRFNPWLIGERDALLGEFLSSIGKSLELPDYAADGKRVAKELKAYSRAFDILKLLPGAEPWASIVKTVFNGVADTISAISDYKTPGIEARKRKVEDALRAFPRRIVVLIDDVDRLFAREAFEMVRIVKAVGELPNIGYVLAWDEKYVSTALDKLQVPLAHSYLDKIVQVRMKVPPLSFSQRVMLTNAGLDRLASQGHAFHFKGSDARQTEIFHAGLAELMESPRDVVRLFDVMASIEPGLRGELQLADMLGLAALMTKAPRVYDLLHQTPQAFVGRRPGTRPGLHKAAEVVTAHAKVRNEAIEQSTSPIAVRSLVQWLFPKVATHDDAFTFDRVIFEEGHLAHPDRLLVALQQSAGPDDVSLAQVRDFIQQPERRAQIAAALQPENCIEFIATAGRLSTAYVSAPGFGLDSLVMAVARWADSSVAYERARVDHRARHAVSRTALKAIGEISHGPDIEATKAVAERIAQGSHGVVAAMSLAASSYLDENYDSPLKAPAESKDKVLQHLGDNVGKLIHSGKLFCTAEADFILRTAPRLFPQRCASYFEVLQRKDCSLDLFAESLFRHAFESTAGQSYAAVGEMDRVECYVALDDLKARGVRRLRDSALTYPARAAWRALVEGRCLYADGSESDL